jgi:hypothetical protein
MRLTPRAHVACLRRRGPLRLGAAQLPRRHAPADLGFRRTAASDTAAPDRLASLVWSGWAAAQHDGATRALSPTAAHSLANSTAAAPCTRTKSRAATHAATPPAVVAVTSCSTTTQRYAPGPGPALSFYAAIGVGTYTVMLLSFCTPLTVVGCHC